MKKIGVTIACALLMFSCAQDDNLMIAEQKSEVSVQTSLTTVEAQTEFAKILSKALSGSEAVRSFLREEAMARFDNDNDVFYPFVKNKIVPGAGGMTFRDVLLSYCDDETRLKSVESALPLLNILVPDLTLFWDFNAQKWDVTEDEVAVLCRDDQTNSLYEDGENIGQLETGDVPGFPCLVVKNNERLRVNPAATRSVDGVGYEFISDAYDGSKRPAQTRHYDTDLDLEPTEDLDAPVSSDELLSEAITAYREFKNVPSACQRDYIYYGITKDNKPGVLNKNIREKLYRFRIGSRALGVISDGGNDPNFSEGFVQEKRYLTNEEIIKKIWTDGEFEFVFNSCIAAEGAGADLEKMIHISCRGGDVFSLSQIHLHHKNSTMFRQSKNFYTTDVQYLHSKWIYPENFDNDTNRNIVFTEPWDLCGKSLSVYLFASERDDEGTETVEKTIVSEFANKADFSIDGGGGIGDIKLSSKLGYGFSTTHSETSTVSFTRKVGSDELGTLVFHFYDPVVTKEMDEGYSLFSVSTGDLQATLLPMKLVE